MNPADPTPMPAHEPPGWGPPEEAPGMREPAYRRQRAPANAQNLMHVGLVLLVLVILAAAVVIAFAALLDIVRIWFEHQYVPIARAVLALGVAGAAVYVLRILVRRTP